MAELVALVSWYQEEPSWLDRAIRSLEKLDCVRHIVALDGAYQEFPRARARSGLAQHEAIHRAAYAIHAGLTLHVPDAPWESECLKRTRLFHYGDQVARPGDWFIVLDADEVITSAPADLADQLEHSVFDVADVTFNEPQPGKPTRRYPIPILFRAIPGIRVEGNHYTYRAPDGRTLWGSATTKRLAPRMTLTDSLVVEHLTHYRDRDRHQAAHAYYRARDAAGLEAGQCCRCSAKATCQVPWRWRKLPDGYAADWTEACSTHAAEILDENEVHLRGWGLDPASRIEHRLGPAPEPVAA